MVHVTNINTVSNGKSSSVKLCLGSVDYDLTPLKNATSRIVDLRINKSESRREMSVPEFAKEAGVTRQAVIKMIATGRVQADKVGERYIIAPEELAKYLLER